jgi:hypothetical protein
VPPLLPKAGQGTVFRGFLRLARWLDAAPSLTACLLGFRHLGLLPGNRVQRAVTLGWHSGRLLPRRKGGGEQLSGQGHGQEASLLLLLRGVGQGLRSSLVIVNFN